MPKRILKHLGYRGTALSIIGIMLAAYGGSLLTSPPYTVSDYLILHHLIPRWTMGALWLAGGIIATAAGFIHSAKSKIWGYKAAVIPPLVLGASYFASWVIWLLPLPSPGYHRGWAAAVLFIGFAGIIMLHAAQPEPHGIQEEGPQDDV